MVFKIAVMVVSLLSGVFQAHLDNSCSTAGISRFSKEPWFLMVGKGICLKGSIKARSVEASF